MELIGIELENYAGFSRHFIPLSRGLNVLVGKNNSGKTALLRGVSALNRFRGEQLFDGVPGYLVQENVLKIRVILRPDASDRPLSNWDEKDWCEFARNRAPMLSEETLVLPTIAYGVCDLLCDGQTVPLFVRLGSGFARQTINTDLSAATGAPADVQIHQVGSLGAFMTAPPSEVGSFFASVKPVRMVEAHRSVRSHAMHRSEFLLSSTAENLAGFLQTLHGRDRDNYEAIENFVTRVFPEFSRVNVESEPTNTLSITLSRQSGAAHVPLTHTGTGVEQILTLATFVVASEPGSIVLIDEPHSYLHPTAERQVIEFLEAHGEHTYLIATHSSVIVNSVEPSRIMYVERGSAQGYQPRWNTDTVTILRAMGYRNSDFAFNDRLIFVEGLSDSIVFPLLLKRCGKAPAAVLDSTGFPQIHGVPGGGTADAPSKDAKRLQTSIVNCEKFLTQMGRATLPHLYFLDGDFSDHEKTLLRKTTNSVTGNSVEVRFLPKYELENYLLDPAAVAAVIGEELRLYDSPEEPPSPSDVAGAIGSILDSDDVEVYPRGKVDKLTTAKGSIVLDRVFQKFLKIPYRKTEHGLSSR